jgi:hypothetical protein
MLWSRDGTWTGTLLEAVLILKPIYPDVFFRALISVAIEHIRNKLNQYITKNTTLETRLLCYFNGPCSR